MVNFNDGNTVTTAPFNIIKILILEKREDFLNALRHYYKNNTGGRSIPLVYVRSSLIVLYFEIQAHYNNWQKEKQNKNLIREIKSINNIERLEEIFSMIDKELYDHKLTRIDLQKETDVSNIEIENEEV